MKVCENRVSTKCAHHMVRNRTFACGNRFLFQGREYDYTTQLYHFCARWYEPETGRWLTEHPLDALGHWVNYYPFCFNDPVNKIWRWLPKDSALLN